MTLIEGREQKLTISGSTDLHFNLVMVCDESDYVRNGDDLIVKQLDELSVTVQITVVVPKGNTLLNNDGEVSKSLRILKTPQLSEDTASRSVFVIVYEQSPGSVENI
jgi:hypothetical protein